MKQMSQFRIKFRKRQLSDFIIDYIIEYITVFWCADYEYDNDNHRQGHFQGQNFKKLKNFNFLNIILININIRKKCFK